ncbi:MULTISPECIES: hypothetical protein [unclassified Bradyrhizobium]|uniref:hypothetical protein n=1 Tax=unclassified Bradyrhizobium TaxID=2631580 RepID=UPI001CD71B91|nr:MULTISPECIES: hypothetical protein [unclassified Bradyrhizobium]
MDAFQKGKARKRRDARNSARRCPIVGALRARAERGDNVVNAPSGDLIDLSLAQSALRKQRSGYTLESTSMATHQHPGDGPEARFQFGQFDCRLKKETDMSAASHSTASFKFIRK